MLKRSPVVAFSIVLLLVSVQAASHADPPAVRLSGDLVTDYRDGEFPFIQDDAREEGQFRFLQTDLVAQSDVTDYTRVFFRSTFARNAQIVSEAWVAQDGFPARGTLTLGRFYLPHGEPVPTLNLSIPALAFHTFSVVGVKYAGNLRFSPRYPIDFEIGIVNQNPLSLNGATVGDAPIVSQPNAALNSNDRDVYGHLAFSDGSTWGSYEATASFRYGQLSPTDMALLRNSGFWNMTNRAEDDRRAVADFTLDYIYGPVRLMGEYVDASEGIMDRTSWSLGGSYRVGLWDMTVTYDELDINTDSVLLSNGTTAATYTASSTWDLRRTTYSVSYMPLPNLKVQAEYEVNKSGARYGDGREVPNDVFALQLLVAF